MEQEAGVLAATYFPSQPWMDLSELGWATVVVADGDRALAQAKADELAQMCWQRREQYLVHKTPIRAGSCSHSVQAVWLVGEDTVGRSHEETAYQRIRRARVDSSS